MTEFSALNICGYWHRLNTRNTVNLLDKYIPNYSGHTKYIKHDRARRRIEIVFADCPETESPAVKLAFEGVSEQSEEKFEKPQSHHLELVIGLDYQSGVYCLHTDVREIVFEATQKTVEYFDKGRQPADFQITSKS